MEFPKFKKQISFEDQQNIALTKKINNTDPLQLDYLGWGFLYESMKNRSLNQKQIRNNITKYQKSVINLVQSQQHLHFDKVSMSRMSMKQKISEYNQQLRIRISQMFDFISMLHMDQLHGLIEFLFGSFMSTIQKMTDSLQNLKQSNYRLQKELQDWKLRKKNILCFSCKKNVQQAKLRNLTSEIGSTASQQIPTQITDNQHQVRKIEAQCRNLQMQLNSMSQQHFFNSQSDHLVQLINEILKNRIITADKQQRKENTTEMLSKCLTDLNQLVKPLQMDYTPILSGKEIQSTKRLGSVHGSKILSIRDLNDNDQYVNKLKVLFAEPLHRFIVKYQKIIQDKYNTTAESKKQVKEVIHQETQTSLIKQPEALKNMEKQLISVTKQLNLVRGSKQKSDKEVFGAYDLMQKNQTRTIETMAENKLLLNINKELDVQVTDLRMKLSKYEKDWEAEKKLIFKNYTQQKFVLMQQISSLQNQINCFNQQNLQRIMRLKFQSKQVQTYACSFSSKKQYRDNQVQTDEGDFANDTIKSKKAMLKTLKSIKMKERTTNDVDEIDLGKSMTSTGQIFAMKRQHMKSKSEIPLLTDSKSNFTSRKVMKQGELHKSPSKKSEINLMRTMPLGENAFRKQSHDFSQHEDQLSRTMQGNSTKKLHMIIKSRKPSITSMIPESMQNSKSYLTSNKHTSRKGSQESIVKKSENKKDNSLMQPSIGIIQNTKNSFNSGLKLNEKPHHIVSNESSQSNLVKGQSHQRIFKSSTFQIKNFSIQDQQRAQSFQSPLKINFNELSSILTYSKEKDHALVSKLKKVSKQQLNVHNGDGEMLRKSVKGKKKVVIKSSLDTPNCDEDLIMGERNLCKNQMESEEIGIQTDLTEFSQQLSETLHQANPIQCLTYNFHDHQVTQTLEKKRQITRIIDENFDYLNQIGLINQLFESQHRQKKLQPCNTEQQNSLTQLKQILKQGQIQQSAFQILKNDIELFFSIQEANKYEHRIGFWNEIESCIMIDNNFSKITEEVQKYFEYLKINRKTAYNEYLIFLVQPYKFIREILDEKNANLQKQRVIREFIRLQKAHTVINKKSFVKDTFRKLIRFHKAIHKSNCNHVEKFLQKIGFYDFQKKVTSSKQRSLEISRVNQESSLQSKRNSLLKQVKN